MMKAQIAQLMQQAQRMQEEMQRAQEQLAHEEVTGSAGAGMVSVRMSGRQDVRGVSIDRSLLAGDAEMLEDLILSGVQKAIEEGKALQQSEMGKLTSGMGLPPGLGF